MDPGAIAVFIPIIAVGGFFAWAISLSPVGKAFADRLRHGAQPRPGTGEDTQELAESVDALRIPDDDKRSPMIAIPGKGEPRGALTHAANLVFPFGLFVIAFRFILLALLAIAGHKSIETEAHLELGTRSHDEGKEPAR